MIINSPIVDMTEQPFAPGVTPMLTGSILDQFGTPLPGGILTTFEITIVNTLTGAVINGAEDADILNAGRGTVNTNGTFQIQLTADDTALDTTGDAQEYRSIILTWKWNADTLVGMRQYDLLIDALAGA